MSKVNEEKNLAVPRDETADEVKDKDTIKAELIAVYPGCWFPAYESYKEFYERTVYAEGGINGRTYKRREQAL